MTIKKWVRCRTVPVFGCQPERRTANPEMIDWVDEAVYSSGDAHEVGFSTACAGYMLARAGDLRAALGIEREEGGK